MHDYSIASLKNGAYLVGKGVKQQLEAPHPTLPSWYAPDFFLQNDKPWHTHETFEIVTKFSFPTREMYLGLPECFKTMFEAMNLEKGVVYTRCPVYNFDPYAVLANLSGHSMVYATEGIVGVTPELLFELTTEGLETMALAATARFEAALYGVKEQEEHRIVIEAIEKALAPYGTVVRGEPMAIRYGHLYHLKTAITLQGDISFAQAVKALHPTPAVGAWPPQSAPQWLLAQNERLPRHRYGAPFGYVFPEAKESRCFVAIRCIQWNNQGAYLFAGAGITPQSHWELEQQEIHQKMTATASLMGLMA